MSLYHIAASHYQTFIFNLVATISQFEQEILHTPPLYRFFSPYAGPNEQLKQGAMFLIAVFHALVSLPVTELIFGRRESALFFRDRLWVRCLWCYLKFLGTIWAMIVFVSLVSQTRRLYVLTVRQSRSLE
jgi:hypothetical protein